MKAKSLVLLFTALTLNGTAAFGQTVRYAFTNFAGLAGEPGSADGTGSAARFKSPYGVAKTRPRYQFGVIKKEK